MIIVECVADSLEIGIIQVFEVNVLDLGTILKLVCVLTDI